MQPSFYLSANHIQHSRDDAAKKLFLSFDFYLNCSNATLFVLLLVLISRSCLNQMNFNEYTKTHAAWWRSQLRLNKGCGADFVIAGGSECWLYVVPWRVEVGS